MAMLTLARTIKNGFLHFYRNGWLSLAVISILSLTLLIISILIVLSIATNIVIKSVQDKVDITIYFKNKVAEEKIIEFRSEILQYQEVKSAEYVSKEQALDSFKAKNADNVSILRAIEAVGENPLQASVNIKAKDPRNFSLIAEAIENSSYREHIADISYAKNKIVIERLNNILNAAKKIGVALAVLFSSIAILITFNAIRITIYSHRQEIEIMRLVGASNYYIRLPFIFEGAIYGIIASIVVMLLLFPIVKIVAPIVAGTISVKEVQDYFTNSFAIIFLIQLLLGTVLGVFSSFIAVRKYLKV